MKNGWTLKDIVKRKHLQPLFNFGTCRCSSMVTVEACIFITLLLKWVYAHGATWKPLDVLGSKARLQTEMPCS